MNESSCVGEHRRTAAQPGPAAGDARPARGRLEAALQHRRQPVPVVRAAPAVHPALRAGRRRRPDEGLAGRLPGGQSRPRRHGSRTDARRSTTGGHAPGLPPVSRRALHPRASARSAAAALQPHSVAVGRLVAGAAAAAAPRDLRRPAGQRHLRTPDRPLCAQLPRDGGGLRARRAGGPGRPPRALARADDLGARIPDLNRPRLSDGVLTRTGGCPAAQGAFRPTRTGRSSQS